ncbi:hypothetical protein FRX31_015413 [Thalictrum thalictroides]|uniref:Uncharacterized protein n=1 Tax=Thalictrum thalictroides TaxID=46969 RepID=A0A7J6WEF3_THATH|nr:hypothetical protein FRX31_015413 [Thalictrum thalictroides]
MLLQHEHKKFQRKTNSHRKNFRSDAKTPITSSKRQISSSGSSPDLKLVRIKDLKKQKRFEQKGKENHNKTRRSHIQPPVVDIPTPVAGLRSSLCSSCFTFLIKFWFCIVQTSKLSTYFFFVQVLNQDYHLCKS